MKNISIAGILLVALALAGLFVVHDLSAQSAPSARTVRIGFGGTAGTCDSAKEHQVLFYQTGTNADGLKQCASNSYIAVGSDAGAVQSIGNAGLEFAQNKQVTWANSNSSTGTADVGFVRSAAGTITVTDGTTGKGWLKDAGFAAFTTTAIGTSTLTNATGTPVTVQAGRTYNCSGVILLQEATAGDGIKTDFGGGTATATSFGGSRDLTDATPTLKALTTLSALTDATTAASVATTGVMTARYSFSITVNAGGTIIPRFAKNSGTTGSAAILNGSNMVCKEQ